MTFNQRSFLHMTVKDLELIGAAHALPDGPEPLELLEIASALYARRN